MKFRGKRLQASFEKVRIKNRIYEAWYSDRTEPTEVLPHYNKNLELVLPLGLGGTCLSEGQESSLKNGIVYSIPPMPVHSFTTFPDPSGKVIVVQINPDLLIRYASGFQGWNSRSLADALGSIPVVHPEHQNQLWRAVYGLSMLKEGDNTCTDPFRDIELVAKILSLLTAGAAAKEQDGPGSARIRRIIDVIESVACSKTSLDEIARKSALSKYHLCRVFQKATGMTVQTYLNGLRINRACELLSQGDKNVTEACFECGFASLSYFIHVFSRTTGLTPGKWMQANRGTGGEVRAV